MKPQLFHLHALSALHCGAGQSAGIVDLPIARDRASNLPLVPGSSLRGVLRAEIENTPERDALAKTLFGPRSIGEADEAHAGALAMGDAHLLLLPIRALAGIVAYATCPFILKRYAKDLPQAPAIPEVGETRAHSVQDNVNTISGKVILEDLDLDAKQCPDAAAWAARIAAAVFDNDTAAQKDLQDRFLILSDTVFSFLAETATEIRARIRIDPQTGIVANGALWYEENLPAESILWGIYAFSDSRVKGETQSADQLASSFSATLGITPLLQLGGKAGVGRGITRFLAGGGQC
ncbi:type III-B CRISPR module RAMP protein Cmr4 [Azonexus sp.]|uniref:type III-B CRISPR module RAMP protein Cmr4 n=1 Tax=Azonexus sp. TaxID=1872668 RepID=UPI0035AF615C